MSAQSAPGLLGVWELLRATKLQDLAPVLLRNGVRSVDDISRFATDLTQDGLAPWQLELLAAHGQGPDPVPKARWDIPAVRPQKRASLQALDPAMPNNRRRCIEALEKGILASTIPNLRLTRR